MSRCFEYLFWQNVKDYKLNLFLQKNQKSEKVTPVTCSEAVKKKIVSGKIVAYYLARMQQLYEKFGVEAKNLRFRELDADERAFYAKETWDFEALTAGKWVELAACNYRTDYDLKGHGKESKKDLAVKEDGEKFVPHIFELSTGIGRTLYVTLYHSLQKDKSRGEKDLYLRLHPLLAPVQVAVFPLVKKDGLAELAKDLTFDLEGYFFDAFYDEKGSIGKRYARMDELGTPFCVTVDYETKDDKKVTLRDRDSMKQKRVLITDLHHILFDLVQRKKLFKDI